MMRVAAIPIVAALLAPGSLLSTLNPPGDGAFTLGVLRQDGLTMPFAAFDGKTWSTAWPSELLGVRIPASIGDVPAGWVGGQRLPGEMTVWTGGVKKDAVALGAPSVQRVSCARQLMLSTAYRASDTLPPPGEQPYPKAGLLSTGAPKIAPIDVLEKESPDWAATAQALLEPFAVVEQGTLNRLQDWRHPLPADARRRVPLAIEALYRAPMDTDGWQAYYVEAVKRYPPGPEDRGCGLLTSVSGWALLGPQFKREFYLGARVTYCDRRDTLYFYPLGRVTARDHIYWVYQMAGYGEEHYVVARPTRSLVEVAVRYTAAACSRF